MFDTALRERHTKAKERDKAVARTRNAFRQSEDNKKKAAADVTEGGLPLHSDTIIRRLMRLNPNLWFEVAHADKNRYGIYLLDPGAEGHRQFICGMPRGMCREYSSMRQTETGEVTDVVPGWRTILARLVRKRLIPEPAAVLLFGTPSVTSKRWQRAVG